MLRRSAIVLLALLAACDEPPPPVAAPPPVVEPAQPVAVESPRVEGWRAASMELDGPLGLRLEASERPAFATIEAIVRADLPDGVRMRAELHYDGAVDRLGVARGAVRDGAWTVRLSAADLEPVPGVYRVRIAAERGQPPDVPASVLAELHRYAADAELRVGTPEAAESAHRALRGSLLEDFTRAADSIERAVRREMPWTDARAIVHQAAARSTSRRAYALFDLHHVAALGFEDLSALMTWAEGNEGQEAIDRLDRFLEGIGNRLGAERVDPARAFAAIGKLRELIAADPPADVTEPLLILGRCFPGSPDLVELLAESIGALRSGDPSALPRVDEILDRLEAIARAKKGPE